MTMTTPQFLSEPLAAPKLDFPNSKETVEVRVINTNIEAEFIGPPSAFFNPSTPGFTNLSWPIYAFLISHGNRHILFDAGVRRDWQNLAPAVVKALSSTMSFHRIDYDVASILDSDASGLNIRSVDIEALIWSHTHFDHIGDPARFPSSTDLIVGPGVKALIQSGYPTKREAMTLDADVAGREVREVDFSQGLKVAGFSAYDCFGDGSFYLLDAPGHSQGHMCGLARTTNQTASGDSTFVFLGADACHHPGMLRPTEFLPLPHSITPSPFASQRAVGAGCPGHALQALLAHNQPNRPVFDLVQGPLFPDIVAAHETLHRMQKLDSVGNTFILLAHDASLLDEIPMFPGAVNTWLSEGWRDKTRWLFFGECEDAVLKQSANSSEVGRKM
ncbi:unnamed protein product [Clonostachys rosea]|uniref:Metallo-beta-lactamase domain-containing protein n=1 Tax=Bionectria ochroleuca TaxID=29856 RepID=A0ABY6TYR4_BIOOC|nr:unnamed protein product [Clonostachys rosea]